MAANTADLKSKAWYRIIEVLRVIAYLLLALIAVGGSLGSAPYTINDYRTGLPQNYPGTPFNWGLCLGVFFFGWLFIELARAALVYLFSGRNIFSSSVATSNPAPAPKPTKIKPTSFRVSATRKRVIDELVEEGLASKLDACSHVPDRWNEDLEAYRNIKLGDDIINAIYIETWYYFVFLTAKKARKHLTEDEQEYFIFRLGGRVAIIQGIIEGWDTAKKKEVASGLEPHLLERWNHYMHGDTVAAYYQQLMGHPSIAHLGSDIIEQFAVNRTEFYSAQNIDRELEKLDTERPSKPHSAVPKAKRPRRV